MNINLNDRKVNRNIIKPNHHCSDEYSVLLDPINCFQRITTNIIDVIEIMHRVNDRLEAKKHLAYYFFEKKTETRFLFAILHVFCLTFCLKWRFRYGFCTDKFKLALSRDQSLPFCEDSQLLCYPYFHIVANCRNSLPQI